MPEILIVNEAQTLVIDSATVQFAETTIETISILEVATQGPPGPPGDGNALGLISADPSNRLRAGADAKLYVPDDLTPDPLAYYILAKN